MNKNPSFERVPHRLGTLLVALLMAYPMVGSIDEAGTVLDDAAPPPSTTQQETTIEQKVCLIHEGDVPVRLKSFLGEPLSQLDGLGIGTSESTPQGVEALGGTVRVEQPVPLQAWFFIEAEYRRGCLSLEGRAETPDSEVDTNGDGMGDWWQTFWENHVNQPIQATMDLDNDGLSNLNEFRWQLLPACIQGTVTNCQDYDTDSWMDGAEATYWNDASNDADFNDPGRAYYDAEANDDQDKDGVPNVHDSDSDDDGLVDGLEKTTYATYPEFGDSDCTPTATTCTSSTGQTNRFQARQGLPGTGDNLLDGAEVTYWNNLRGAGAWNQDPDGDTIPNLRDADSDNDLLLDGTEVIVGQVIPDVADTDADALLDGHEEDWDQDTDQDGFINANDPDSDNDGMPDGWEVAHGFQMRNAADASLDREGDLLTNLEEYQWGADPDNPDTEGDLLWDGHEVHLANSSPLTWDTDGDGMADQFEFVHGFNPRNPTDAGQDADADSFDQNADGTPEWRHSNLEEYRYGRPADWREGEPDATGGFTRPWPLGTQPHTPDTDSDTAPDGFEAYFGTDARVPNPPTSDDDKDGLTFEEEVKAGTDPDLADTDGDGLCDGGRDENCRFPGLPQSQFQPGESDYGSTPWSPDSDTDGLTDTQEALRWDPGASGSGTDPDADQVNGLIDPDNDNDRLSDGAEVNLHQTQPEVPDTDGDGLVDGEEVLDHATQPLNPDTDGDLLTDGEELLATATRPLLRDSDGDGLGDGEEVNAFQTDPNNPDTDADQLWDGWEVRFGTLVHAPDADQDPDTDGLPNLREAWVGTDPHRVDTDGDTLPDAYEDQYDLWFTLDADEDGLSDVAEFQRGSNPRLVDTDGEGFHDGEEVVLYSTDPTKTDTDADGLTDAAEAAKWVQLYGATSWNNNHDNDAFPNALTDADSDNDGLDDGDEFLERHTDPRDADTDGDGLSDHDEATKFDGQYEPTKADTDGDGQSDGLEVALADTNGDVDGDGLKNGDEATYGTNPTQRDSDCDGAPDGGELQHWSSSWNTGGNRLLNPDVDGDTLLDGLELGTVGTPREALIRSNPAIPDTDGDGLRDDQEARNNVRVSRNPDGSCNVASGAAAEPVGPALPGPAFPQAVTLPPGVLVKGQLYQDPDRIRYALDDQGVYILGGYGVRLYANAPQTLPGLDAPTPVFTMAAPGTNGLLTHPLLPDTDGDGLKDGEELSGTRNPYKGQRWNADFPGGNTDPLSCDTDHDGLGDGLEVDVTAAERPLIPVQECGAKLRDEQPAGLPSARNSVTNPNSLETDGDGKTDKGEDANGNGWVDVTYYGYTLTSAASGPEGGESDPSDLDSDDDGIPDATELVAGSTTFPLQWDSDLDGLSDGLETGVQTPVLGSGMIQGTNVAATVLGDLQWSTWQPWQGSRDSLGNKITTRPSRLTAQNPHDTDGDGILDGLEDVNHNGIYGDVSCLLRRSQQDPCQEELNTNPIDINGDGKPEAADTDNDGILDGRELLVYGSYTFPEIVGSYVGDDPWSFGEIVFDANNPWETDPRGNNTDADAVPDGKDLNPRADALFKIDLGSLMFAEQVDSNDMAELYIDELKVDLPFSRTEQYLLGMVESDQVQVPSAPKQWNVAPAELIRRITNRLHAHPAGLGPADFKVEPETAGEELFMRFNLLDEVPTNLDPTDTSIDIFLGIMEGDDGADDVIDVNPENSERRLRHSLKLGGDVADLENLGSTDPGVDQYLAWDQGPDLVLTKGAQQKGDNDEDMEISYRSAHNVAQHFLTRFVPGLPNPASATCFGGAGCVT